MESLRLCSEERKVKSLEVSKSVGDYGLPQGSEGVALGIPGEHQAANAGLAVGVLTSTDSTTVPISWLHSAATQKSQ